MWPLKSNAAPRTLRRAPGILALVQDRSDQLTITDFAKRIGCMLELPDTVEHADHYAAQGNLALIILDRDVIADDWRTVVRAMAAWPATPCVLLASGVADSYLFEELIKYGGFDVIPKPLRMEELKRLSGLAIAFWQHKHHDGSSE